VRFPLLFELLLVRLLLFLELFLKLGVGFLKVTQVVLKEPCLSSPLLLQLVNFSSEIDVLCQLLGDALVLGSKLSVTTDNGFQLFGFLL
jgi:hypothetical protein